MGTSATRELPFIEKPPRRISIESFLRKYRKGGPGVKYEFNKGIIEKTEAMKYQEQYLANNILEKFEKTLAFKGGMRLIQELEVWTSEEQWRKPDLCLTTPVQVAAAAKGAEPVPEFVIEVISKNDKIIEVKSKANEYFDAGVKILWHIFPHNQTVEIYRSPEDIEVCRGIKSCSAEPVVMGLKIKADDIFKMP